MPLLLREALERTFNHLGKFAKGIGSGKPGYAPKTARLYQLRIIDFMKSDVFHAFADKPIENLDVDSVQQWLSSNGWSAAKETQSVTALRQIPVINHIEWKGLLNLKAAKRDTVVGAYDLYSERELQMMLDAPLGCFGMPPAQERNKAMFALTIEGLCSLDEIKAMNVENVHADSVTMRLRPMFDTAEPVNTNQVPLSPTCMQILHDYTSTIQTNYPDAYVLRHHPLFFHPQMPTHALTEKTIWQVFNKALENISGSHKGMGSGGGLNAVRLSSARVRYGRGESRQHLIASLGLTESTHCDVLEKYLKMCHGDDPLRNLRAANQ